MNQTFAELLARLKNGDTSAFQILMSQHGETIRRAIRVRMTGNRLRRVLDSEDVVQSVFRELWLTRDELNIDSPAHLLNWLHRAAQNRLTDHARMQGAQKRGGDLNQAGSEHLHNAPTNKPSPLSELSKKEFLEAVIQYFTPEERAIAVAHAEGFSWEDLSKRFGKSPEALRKQYTRACLAIRERLQG